jgi:hypothetical protein
MEEKNMKTELWGKLLTVEKEYLLKLSYMHSDVIATIESLGPEDYGDNEESDAYSETVLNDLFTLFCNDETRNKMGNYLESIGCPEGLIDYVHQYGEDTKGIIECYEKKTG